MPLHWEIIHDEQLVALRTEGALRLDDVMAYLESVRDNDAIGYRKLCDARAGHCDMTEMELLSYLGAVKGFAAVAPLGPQAVVVTEASVRAHEPMLRMLSINGDRELRMFTRMQEARNWLELQPVPVGRGLVRRT